MGNNRWTRINQAKARARKAGADDMTGPERKRSAELAALLAAGEILWWAREPWSLRLGRACHYVPDFVVLEADQTLTCEEVKGTRGWGLDAKGRVKVRTAAEAFPFLRFRALLQQPKKAGGGWAIEDVLPFGEQA
jgi:hypothetical protein